MKNKIGVVTSTYINYDTEQALKGISDAGFKFVELGSAPGFFEHIVPRPEEITQDGVNSILKLCDNYGLEVYVIAGHTRLEKENAVKNFKKVIDTASMFGADFVSTGTGPVNNKDEEKRFFNDINILGDYASSKNITIGLETHDNWLNNGKKGAEIIKKINHKSVKMVYDTANVIFYGDTQPYDDIKYALPHLAIVHLKDKRGGFKVWDFPALGEGETDFSRIFDSLKDFEGPMSVEVEFDGKKHELDEVNKAVEKSYDFLKTYNYVK